MAQTSPSATQTQSRTPEEEAELYYAHARAIGFAMASLLATLGVHPHKASVSGLHLIFAAISGMAKADPASAAQTADEVAQRYIAFMNEIGMTGGQDGAQSENAA